MKLIAIERGAKRPSDYSTGRAPDDMKALTLRCIDKAGTIRALAKYLDVTEAAPGHWARGVHKPSKRYREKMRAYLEGEE